MAKAAVTVSPPTPAASPRSRPSPSSSAWSNWNGLGGEPGTHTSTGTTSPTLPSVAYEGLTSPPLTASVPAAITTFGSGIAS